VSGTLLVATIVTALATGVLAWVTSKLVTATKEMAAASNEMVTATKDMATQPALVPNLWVYAGNVFLEILNAGDGAALHLDLTITWKVGNNVVTVLNTSETHWRASVLPAGKRVRFNPPQIQGSAWLKGEALGVFDCVAVTGMMRNTRGEMMHVEASIEEPGQLYDFEVESQRQYTANYEPDEIVAAAVQKIAKLIEQHLRPSAPAEVATS